MNNEVIYDSALSYNLLKKIKFEDGKYNFKDENGNILSDHRFLEVLHFSNKIAQVQFEDFTWNFINTEGNLLLKENAINITFYYDSATYEVIFKDGSKIFIDKDLSIYKKDGVLK